MRTHPRQERPRRPEVPPLNPESTRLHAWNRFLSSLAFAELAASNACVVISRFFVVAPAEIQNREKYAKLYDRLADEELEHFNAVRDLCSFVEFPPQMAQDVYAGKLLTGLYPIDPYELIAVIHLVFEPTALAIMSHIRQNADKILPTWWAISVQSALESILADEARHVRQGREALEERWPHLPPDRRKAILKSLRRHYNFLRFGLESFFKDEPSLRPFVLSMRRRMSIACENAKIGFEV